MADIIVPTEYQRTDRKPQAISRRDEAIVFHTIRCFDQYRLMRDTFGSHWEEIAELIDPPSRNTFFFGNYNWPGQKKTERQVDATGMLALQRFCAILISLLTPENMKWHKLEAMDPYVQKDRQVRMWLDRQNQNLFNARKMPTSNFVGQNYPGMRALGAYGTRGMMIEPYFDPIYQTPGLRHINVPLGELYIHENFQGQVDGFIRNIRMTARQMAQRFPETWPQVIEAALKMGNETPWNILHHVELNQQYDPRAPRFDWRSRPWVSYYISMEGKSVLEESGYFSFPLAVGRYVQTPGEVYGRSPAMDVLPALKTLNSEKRTFLTQGHRAAAPVLLTHDDGLMSMDMRPNAINVGGVTADGKPLVQVLPTGQIQTTIEMMQEERGLINDAFLVSLFQILTESPEMTATEVLERVNEKGILLAPTVGRQGDECYGTTMIPRELDILSQFGQVDPMPPLLRETGGLYKVTMTGPLAMAMRAGEAAGYQRSVQVAQERAQMTGDPAPLDIFDADVADYEIATEINGVPERWMASPKMILQKRNQRAQQNAIQQKIQALPAQAAMMKAQNTVDKNQQQQLPPAGP